MTRSWWRPTGLRDGTWIDRKGSPLTAARADHRTVPPRALRPARDRGDRDDPKAYSRPWTVTLNQDLAVDTELLDYHCTDNEKSAERLGGK